MPKHISDAFFYRFYFKATIKKDSEIMGKLIKMMVFLPIALYLYYNQTQTLDKGDALAKKQPSADYHPHNNGWGKDNSGDE